MEIDGTGGVSMGREGPLVIHSAVTWVYQGMLSLTFLSTAICKGDECCM